MTFLSCAGKNWFLSLNSFEKLPKPSFEVITYDSWTEYVGEDVLGGVELRDEKEWSFFLIFTPFEWPLLTSRNTDELTSSGILEFFFHLSSLERVLLSIIFELFFIPFCLRVISKLRRESGLLMYFKGSDGKEKRKQHVSVFDRLGLVNEMFSFKQHNTNNR